MKTKKQNYSITVQPCLVIHVEVGGIKTLFGLIFISNAPLYLVLDQPILKIKQNTFFETILHPSTL